MPSRGSSHLKIAIGLAPRACPVDGGEQPLAETENALYCSGQAIDLREPRDTLDRRCASCLSSDAMSTVDGASPVAGEVAEVDAGSRKAQSGGQF